MSLFLAYAAPAICVGIALCITWFLVCNERTLADRMVIIRGWRSTDLWAAADEFESVSYGLHLWALFFFRDPIRLYGPVTQRIMGEAAVSAGTV